MRRDPLRRVVLWSSRGLHVLECGHELGLRYTAYGMAQDQRRCRCSKCSHGQPRDFTPEQVRQMIAEAGGEPASPVSLGPLFEVTPLKGGQ